MSEYEYLKNVIMKCSSLANVVKIVWFSLLLLDILGK